MGSGSSATAVLGATAAGASGIQSGRVRAIHATTPAVASPASTPVAIHAARDEPLLSVTEFGVRVGTRCRHRARGTHAGRLEAIDPLEQDERLFAVRAALDGRGEECPGRARVAAIESGGAGVQELIALALPLGDGAAGTVDVRPAPARGRDRGRARASTR